MRCEHGWHDVKDCTTCMDAMVDENRRLRAFKDYVHRRLDYEGVPECKHVDALSMRVCERLNWVFARLAQRTSHTHRCRECKHEYTPEPGRSEDCPVCGL